MVNDATGALSGTPHVRPHAGLFSPFLTLFYLLGQVREFRTLGQILALVVWIGGIAYCDRVAEEISSNEWVARLAGILLPVIGPVIYIVRRSRFRAKQGLKRDRHYR
jgi:hypothetical protein